jgi:nicotinate dehydrogenase subunit B
MTGFMHEKEFSRKSFLKGSGALVVGFSMVGTGLAAKASAASSAVAPGGVDLAQLDSWIAVHPDNSITLMAGMSNISGQATGLAQIVAEELDLSMAQVHMAPRDTSTVPNQGAMYSGFSISARNEVRAAAAAARQALLGLAATKLNVPVASLTVSKGVISAGSTSATYGDLLGDKLFNVTLPTTPTNRLGITVNAPSLAPGQVPAKPVSSYSLVGTSVPRVDIPDKVAGTFTYVQNVRVPGMVHGRIVLPRGQHAYGAGAPIVSVDESSIKHLPGAQVVRKGDFLGVVAPKEYDAIQAATQLKVVWQWPETASLPGSGNLFASMRATTPLGSTKEVGSVDRAFASAAKTVAGTFAWPFHMHGTLGPPAAVASVTPAGCTAFVCSQNIFTTQQMLAALLGIDRSTVRVYEHEGAGDYGQNQNEEPAAAAAIMSQIVGKPVRVQMMRWDDHGWDNYANPQLQDIRAAIDANGKITAYDIRAWIHVLQGSTTDVVKPGFYTSGELVGMPRTPGTSAGLYFDEVGNGARYTVPNRRQQATPVSYLRNSWMRGPFEAQTNFASEQIIDDLAQTAGMDPIAFRKVNFDTSLTSQRYIHLLDVAAQKMSWQPRPPASNLGKGTVVTGRGIALGQFSGTLVVNGAEVEVNKKTGKVRVKSLLGVGDPGLVINPGGVENQMLGSMVQFLSRTLVEEVAFNRKNVSSLDWASYPILRFRDVPNSVTAIVEPRNDLLPGTAVGEFGGQAVPAAVANAFFDATGVRIRQLPMTPARVRAVLANGGAGAAGYSSTGGRA